MKQPKKLTRAQKEAVSAYHLSVDDWMHLEDVGDSYIKIINKKTGKVKIIDKHQKAR